jgi:hypothetical protein
MGKPIEIKIWIGANGEVQCSFPEDKFVCYGMLEAAKDAIREACVKDKPLPSTATPPSSSRIVIPDVRTPMPNGPRRL